MIKTLRITSVVAAILAVILFIFPVVFGGRSDESIEGFLNSPSVIEKFSMAMGNQAKTGESRSSPLVQQATVFASYLNPKTKDASAFRDTGGATSLSLPVTPKFRVIATTYCQAQPELSLALIDEPGKGMHWVRQSSKVGHLVIEQVRDGLVVVKGGKGTFELMVEERPQMSLLEGASSVPKKAGGQKPTLTAPGRTDAGVTRTRRSPLPRQLRTAKNGQLEDLADRLKEISYKSDKTDSGRSAEEKAAMMEKLISNFKSSRVGTEEAKKLGDLGKQLKTVREDPNRSQPATSGSKNRSKPAQNKPVRK
ncbi:MAG: hypothetical protein ACYS9C_02990 [Planctomycetota bacterium]|jgi:hypothetical protein